MFQVLIVIFNKHNDFENNIFFIKFLRTRLQFLYETYNDVESDFNDFFPLMTTTFTYFFLLLSLFFLLWCGWSENTDIVSDTKNFFVTTQNLSEFDNQAFLTKTSRVSSSSDITLTTNAPGRVSTIFVREWDNISAGQQLIQLSDNVANYYLNLQRAENELDRAKINYDSNKISLDKQVTDAVSALDRIKFDYENAKVQANQDIIQAQNNRDDANANSDDSISNLEIQRIEANIAKSELDYDNSLISDEQTIAWFRSTLIKDFNAQLIFLDDVIEFSDTLLWVTIKNDNFADDIDQFLWARDVGQKNTTEMLLRELIAFREWDFQTLYDTDIVTQDDIYTTLDIISLGYDKSKILLNNVETMLNNSLSSVGDFSESDISGYVTTGNGFQSSLQANYTAFVSYQNTVDTFLKTYKNTQLSLQKNIDLLKKDREILLKNLATGDLNADSWLSKVISSTQNTLNTLQIQVDAAVSHLSNAEQVRDVTLRSLQNNIQGAQISYNSALKDYKKLTITAPVDGVVWTISVDIGQEISNGTPVMQISWKNSNELQISFTKNELPFVNVGDIVFVTSGTETFTGSLSSLSWVADANLNYTSRVLFNSDIGISWDIIQVDVPISTWNILLPLDIVTVQSQSKGSVYVIQSGSIVSENIELGNIYDDLVELTNIDILNNMEIVTSNVSNFDPSKFELKIR